MKHVIRRVVTVFFGGMMLICPVWAMHLFPDVDETTDYYEAVDYVSGIELMVGDEKGYFNPDKIVTRAEIATILCNIAGETDNLLADGTFFSDVPASHWANPYIVTAAKLGLVSGYGDGRYGPEDILTYEQVLTMVIRAFGYADFALQLGAYPDGFVQAAAELEYTRWISAEKGDPLTRKDVAIILFNAMV